MRLVPVLALAGCATQNGFAYRFVDEYCGAYTRCDTSGRPCPVRLEEREPTYAACDFDREAARECMKTEFTCNDEVRGFEVVVVPEACHQVCGDGVE